MTIPTEISTNVPSHKLTSRRRRRHQISQKFWRSKILQKYVQQRLPRLRQNDKRRNDYHDVLDRNHRLQNINRRPYPSYKVIMGMTPETWEVIDLSLLSFNHTLKRTAISDTKPIITAATVNSSHILKFF